MTKKTQPTDAEILDAADDFRSQYKHGGTTFDEFDALGFARAIEAEVRKQDEALIRQMLEALETCNDGDGCNGPYQYYETVPVEEAVAAARARLLEADLAKLTERGAVAWPGIDAQDLRDGSKP